MKKMPLLTLLLVLLLGLHHLLSGPPALTGLYISQLKDSSLGWLSYGALITLQAMLCLVAATMWKSRSYGFSILYALAVTLLAVITVTDARSPDHVFAYIVLVVLVPTVYGLYFWVQGLWFSAFALVALFSLVGLVCGTVCGPLLQKGCLALFLFLLNRHHSETTSHSASRSARSERHVTFPGWLGDPGSRP